MGHISSELFENEFSNPIYKAAMSVERLEDIRRFLRFDDKRTKKFNLQTDHMAAFRYIGIFLFQITRNGIIRVNL